MVVDLLHLFRLNPHLILIRRHHHLVRLVLDHFHGENGHNHIDHHGDGDVLMVHLLVLIRHHLRNHHRHLRMKILDLDSIKQAQRILDQLFQHCPPPHW